MVTVRATLEISAPAIELVKALPEGAKLCVVLGAGEVFPLTVEVQVYCEPDQVQAVRDAYARAGIQLGDTLVTGHLTEGYLVPGGRGELH